MKVWCSLDASLPGNQSTAMALGTFDGVHKGHQALIQKMMDIAQAHEVLPLVFAFSKPPLYVTNPPFAPPVLTLPTEKIVRMKSLGVQNAVLVPFSKSLAQITPEAFVLCLKKYFRVSYIVVGEDFRFGCRAQGDVHELQTLAQKHSFSVHVIKKIEMDGNPISSSTIRQSLTEGNMQMVEKCLGTPYRVCGYVQKGKQIGQRMGFPTANLMLSGYKAVPSRGVYVTCAIVGDDLYPAVSNVGYNPTVSQNNNLKIETHVIGYQGNLYGKPFCVDFLHRLRDEKEFASEKALVEQLEKDVKCAKHYFSKAHFDGGCLNFMDDVL